jgi:type I restriction enzyme, S subunit
MNNGFPMIPLSECLLPIERPEVPAAGKLYRQIGVRLWGEGAYERESIDGSQTKYATLTRVEKDDIIVNKIWARNGSVAVVSECLAGCYGSGEFPTFTPIRERLNPRWFHWFTKTKSFWNQCDDKSRGTSGKNRIRPEKFLEILIPLPSLEEQQRIVARIEELTAKIEEARGLRREAVETLNGLIASSSNAIFEPRPGWTEAYVRDFCDHPQYGYTESATTEPIGPRFLRITDIQNGQVNWNIVPFCRCPNPEQYLLKENDLVFARTGATTGKSFLIRDCPEAIFASYLIRLRVKRLVSAEYLYRYFQTPSYWTQITNEKKGTGQPNVNGAKLANIRVPIPPPEEQDHIVAYLDDLQGKVDSLKQLQSETSAELDALLPSILNKAFKGEL